MPWVEKRRGYTYGVKRKDIVLINRGRGLNNTIFPYTDGASDPIFIYYEGSGDQKVIKNLIIERNSKSTKVTNVIKIVGLNNVLLKNIVINTPESDLVSDRAISINNSTNITFEDVEINGTYSSTNKSGYGIFMNNVWNSNFIRLSARGKWGVFGTNNMNNVKIIDSDINRFDIHCYGRDVFCKNTIFRYLYNQFSSFYGILEFKKLSIYKFYSSFV